MYILDKSRVTSDIRLFKKYCINFHNKSYKHLFLNYHMAEKAEGKDIGRIKKNDDTEIVVRLDDFGGKRGLTIREFVTSEKYTGFTKSGTRISAEKFLEFRELINSVDINELKSE